MVLAAEDLEGGLVAVGVVAVHDLDCRLVAVGIRLVAGM